MGHEGSPSHPAATQEKARPSLDIGDAIAKVRGEEIFIGAQKIAQASEEEQQLAAKVLFEQAADDSILIEKLGIMLPDTAFITALKELVEVREDKDAKP